MQLTSPITCLENAILEGTNLDATSDLETANQLKFARVFKVIVHFACYEDAPAHPHFVLFITGNLPDMALVSESGPELENITYRMFSPLLRSIGSSNENLL